jgi:pyruvate dehydrogenase E2 component (dihydrolipoamide acetyltransferase)
VLEADLRDLYFSSPRLSETARRQAEPGVTANVSGTGLGGLVRAVDLGVPAAPPSSPAEGISKPHAPGAAEAGRISTTRERIAKRLRESLTTTAQYTLHSSANAGELLSVRKRLKGSAATSGVTINDLVVFCTVQALLDMPDLNAEFVDGRLYKHSEIHMGFACDTDRGLIVPVVRDCQNLSLLGLSHCMAELASQAVQGTIAVDDMNGGTFTVSNLGSLGIESFTPLLNPPQVAILGVDAIQLKPVRKRDGNVEFIDAIGLSLTLDHQIIDGAPGARFLKVVKDRIENVEKLCTI